MTAPTLMPTNLPKTLLTLALGLGTLKTMIATATYSPNQDTLDYVNDVTNEAAGTGYTAGGITLTDEVVNLDTATNVVSLAAGDIDTAGLSVSGRWAVTYVDTGTPATSPVLAYTDLSEGIGGNVTCTGITWDPDGIIQFTVAA